MENNSTVHIGNKILRTLKDDVNLKSASSLVIITDTIVSNHWLAQVEKYIPNKRTITIGIKPGEENKTIETLEIIWRKMIRGGADRLSVVLTLGGGVVCDIGGFAAATYMRGIPVIHIPTTLLAQVDASIGGKTAIDFAGIKNSIGVFHQPRAVYIDVQTLQTLPQRQIVSGMAEIIKQAIIAEKDFFAYLSHIKLSDMSDDEWVTIVKKSADIKQKIVEQDEKEKNGIRKQLNFGHTVGHAIEALSLKSSNPLLHGEAVAIGMVAEVKMSNLTGHISSREEELITSVLEKIGLPTKAIGYDLGRILKLITNDKKNNGGTILWSLPITIGSAVSDLEISLNNIKKGILKVTQLNT